MTKRSSGHKATSIDCNDSALKAFESILHAITGAREVTQKNAALESRLASPKASDPELVNEASYDNTQPEEQHHIFSLAVWFR